MVYRVFGASLFFIKGVSGLRGLKALRLQGGLWGLEGF